MADEEKGEILRLKTDAEGKVSVIYDGNFVQRVERETVKGKVEIRTAAP